MSDQVAASLDEGVHLLVQAGTGTDWAHVTAGFDFLCALRKNGTLWCWGTNDQGQLGIGRQSVDPTPVRIRTGATG